MTIQHPMQAKELTETIPGLCEVLGGMEVLSAPGKRALREREMLTDIAALEIRLDRIDRMISYIGVERNRAALARISAILPGVNDISNTISQLSSGGIADDIELFEIKNLAIRATEIGRITSDMGLETVEIPDVSDVVSLLDPDGTGTPHFHIFNSYDSRLPAIREELRRAAPDSPEAAGLYAAQSVVEEEVKKELSENLRKHADALGVALSRLSELDIVMAAARQSIKENYCRPEFTESGETEYRGLINPVTKRALEHRGASYQPVDIAIIPGVTLITGANMGGKSVTLKTLALSQALAQLGFHIPASGAKITPVEKITLIIGDAQSERNGLSSYAAEMMAVSGALSELKSGRRLLLLIDEPARTTNPEEGRALAAAVMEVASRYDSKTVITSHYSGLTAKRHWRVRGLPELTGRNTLTLPELSDMMDYRLEPASDEEPPREALRIAVMLGIDPDIITAARKYIKETTIQ